MKMLKRIGATFVAAVLVAGAAVLAMPAPNAEAHTPRVAATCANWTVDLTSYGQGYQVSVFTDSQEIVTNAPINDRYTNSGTWPAAATTHHLRIQITRIDGRGDQYTGAFTANVNNCTLPRTEVQVPTLTVTPPTCTAPGSLPFLNNPPAQNANGYEFPGQGYRVYIAPGFNGPGTYTATIQRIGPGFDPAFPGGTTLVGGPTTQVLTVLPATGYQNTDPNAPCFITPQEPRVEVTYAEWSGGECTPGDATVHESRVATTTTTTFSFDPVTGTYTANEPTSVQVTEERDRPLTEQERIDCAGPQPEPIETSSTSEWTAGSFECDDTEVGETRTVTTYVTPYVLNEDYIWVEGETIETGSVTESRTRPLTDEELADQAEACEVTPPTTTPPTSTPPTAPPPTPIASPPTAQGDAAAPGLPQTGFEGGAFIALLGLLTIAAGMVIRKVRA